MNILYRTTNIISIASLSCALFSGIAFAADDDLDAKKLLSMSLKELSDIEVTSVSKKAEKASEAASAIYVITKDDIARSGATQIPDLLRRVPGLDVAQSGNHQWSISSRGFNGSFANKLLVLIDGRSIYTPLFSGVYWDVQDTPLQDIERIEVIRGPGATLFGANAVNGVINIITKNAKDTQGGFASATVGNQDRSLNTVRYGAKINNDSYARAYAKYDERDEFRTTTGDGAKDPSHKYQVGFRADINQTSDTKITIQGDAYEANNRASLFTPTLTSPFTVNTRDTETAKGVNLLARVEHKYSEGSDLSVQAYFDNAQRDRIALNNYSINTFDLDVQHTFTKLHGQEIVWGAGYRLVSDSIDNSDYLTLTPDSRTDNTFSAFVQDKITLNPSDVFLTLGTKLEHNDYTGFEVQPSARLTYLINDKQTLWGSVAHAVRTPNRSTDDGQLILTKTTLPGPTTAFVGTSGSRSLESEELNAYEIGYRIQPEKSLSIDTTAFYNDYSRIVMGSAGNPLSLSSPTFGSYVYVPIIPANINSARSFGFEASTKWEATDYLDFSAAYSYIDTKFADPDNGFLLVPPTPQQQFNIQSNLRLPHNVEINNALYYVDDIKGSAPIPSYFRFDTRIAWKMLDNVELSLVGQNLLDSSHPEFSGFVYQQNAEVPRAIYGNITWKF